jgi:hypothetical protein
MKTTLIFGLSMALCLCAQAANAELVRTWVSQGFGDDRHDCSRAAPCATFEHAVSQTAAGGELNCVDAGQVSATSVFISKSITIDCGGTFGSYPSTNSFIFAIIVNAPGAVVRLRNLSIQGFGSTGSTTGIEFVTAHSLYIENCNVFGFHSGIPQGQGSGIGIFFAPRGAETGRLFVVNSQINNNGIAASGGGIIIQPFGTNSARVVIENSRVEGNTYGIFANSSKTSGTVSMAVHNSVVANNAVDGISSYTTGSGIASTFVERSSSVQNGNTGVAATGAGAFVTLSQSTVASNVNGIAGVSGGKILSFQDNRVVGNINNGVPNLVLGAK